MAASEAALLAEEHRQAQGQLRSQALADFVTLWPLWTGDAASFATLVQATLPLIRVYKQASASLGGAYYEHAREFAGAPGSSTAILATDVIQQQIVTSMFATGQSAARSAIAGGQTGNGARKATLTSVSGAVTRHVLNGGRETILQSVAADDQAVGWARVTDGAPCAFCLTLASRGAVYKTEETAGFEAHDHCGCAAMPLWDDTSLPATTDMWRELYDRAQREAEASDTLDRGTSNDRLNAVRRLLAAERAG